jgi:hypothetical protein
VEPDTLITMMEKHVGDTWKSMQKDGVSLPYKQVINVFKDNDTVVMTLSISSDKWFHRHTAAMPLSDLGTESGWKQWTQDVDSVLLAKAPYTVSPVTLTAA